LAFVILKAESLVKNAKAPTHMAAKISIFPRSGMMALLGLVLLSACSGPQLKQRPETASVPRAAPADTAFYTAKPPHPDGTGKVYMGREIAGIMSAAGGSWLERSNRQQEENVEAAIARMPLAAGSVVADIGAGTGYYTFRIAPKVPQGKVLAVEVQKAFVEALEERKQELGLKNVQVVKGASRSPNLPEASVDLALLVDVYHELEYPREMLQAIHRALKPEGKLLLLEYRAEDPSIPIKELHKMSVAQVNKELGANGFKLYKQEGFLPIQHFLLYEKK
jgi:predicted methyltransferase